jgi:hypothetical protein
MKYVVLFGLGVSLAFVGWCLVLSGARADDCLNLAANKVYCTNDTTTPCSQWSGTDKITCEDLFQELVVKADLFAQTASTGNNAPVDNPTATCTQTYNCVWDATLKTCSRAAQPVKTTTKGTYKTVACPKPGGG